MRIDAVAHSSLANCRCLCHGLGCAIFFLLAAIIGGVFALDLTFRNLEQARASNAWPTAPGHIVSSGVREYEEWNRDKEEQWTYYAAQVTYAYTVNGVLYTGDRINFSTAVRWGDRGPADKIIARYLTGATAEVYYNPENPQEAVLEPGESMAVGLPLSLAIAAWSAAIGLMIVILRALFRWSSR